MGKAGREKVKRELEHLNVLFVASRYLPHHGGLETVVHELAHLLQTNGHTVAIVTNRYPRRLPGQETIDGVGVTRLHFLYPRLTYLKAGRLDLWLAGFVYFPLTLVQLLLIIRCFKPDVVNLHYLGSPGLFLLLLHRLLRFRFVVSLHGGDVDGEPYQSKFNLWLYRAVLARADRVTACSRSLLEQALSLAPGISAKACVIHNGVDLELFANAAPYVYSRPFLFAVGQLSRHKGFDLLISAFAKLGDSAGDVDLLIAGDGDERGSLQSQVRDCGMAHRIHLLGAKDHAQVASLMRGSLAVIIPSRREPFGIVGLEALASGKPVIASRAGGLVEALEGAEVTWINPNDLGSFVSVLMHVLTDREHSITISKANRQKAAGFSWSRVYERYIAAFQVERTATPLVNKAEANL